MLSAAIVGAGLIGRSWAVVFARAGWTVRLTDSSAEALAAAPGLIREALDDLHTYGLADNPAEAAARVAVAASLGEAVAEADLVQENGPETVEAKRAIFADLDRLAPRAAILASSTSFIPASPPRPRAPRLLALVHPRTPVLRGAARPRALPGRASCHPASSCAGRGTLRGALDCAGGDRTGARALRQRRTGADHRQPRDPRLRPQPPARGAAGRGIPASRRGHRQPAGP